MKYSSTHRHTLSKTVLAGLMMFFLQSPVVAQQKSKLPNIIYILADDLGYGDVSINNPLGKISTPNIDALAKQGMRFTDAHTTSSVCTPSRYSILTGRYPWRSRLPLGVLRGYSRTLIEDDLPTVADLLKTRNYQTAVVGKWHLGLDWVPKNPHKDSLKNDQFGIREEMKPEHIDFSQVPISGPRTQGFDYSFILPASLDMPPYCYLENDRLIELPTGYTKGNRLESGFTGPFWREGLMAPSFDFYDVLPFFNRKASDFIRKQHHAETSFFLYFPMPAPHTPWVPTDNYRGTSKAGEYGDFVQQVDEVVGQLMSLLDSLRMADNTMVIFSSDNGPYWRENFVQQFNHKAAGEFRGMKGDAFEGGHRVPFIVRYPGKVKPGTVSKATTSLANLMSTCAELVGDSTSKYETEDSYSILPVLTGRASIVEDQPAIINISSKGTFDIRKGNWKLITALGSGGFTVPSEIIPQAGGPVGQLYDLDKDIHEDQNLYNEKPEKVKELLALLANIQKAPMGKRYKHTPK